MNVPPSCARASRMIDGVGGLALPELDQRRPRCRPRRRPAAAATCRRRRRRPATWRRNRPGRVVATSMRGVGRNADHRRSACRCSVARMIVAESRRNGGSANRMKLRDTGMPPTASSVVGGGVRGRGDGEVLFGDAPDRVCGLQRIDHADRLARTCVNTGANVPDAGVPIRARRRPIGAHAQVRSRSTVLSLGAERQARQRIAAEASRETTPERNATGSGISVIRFAGVISASSVGERRGRIDRQRQPVHLEHEIADGRIAAWMPSSMATESTVKVRRRIRDQRPNRHAAGSGSRRDARRTGHRSTPAPKSGWPARRTP